MKKLAALLICAALLTGTGCTARQPAEDVTTTIPQTSVPVEVTTQPETEAPIINDYIPDQVPMAAISLPVSDKNTYTEDDILLFTYKCQTISLIIPDSEIEHKVILDLQTRLDGFTSAAQEISDRAKNDYKANTDWNPYFYEILYTPERIDLSVLSLFGENTSWVGGSHPSRSCVSANYDLMTGDVLTLGSILTHEDTLDTLCSLLIEEVAEIKAEKYLFEDYSDTIENRFAQNESYNESWFFSNTGLSFYFSPYEIAPYSSGVITVTIPYEKLTGVIEDRYFPAERDAANGTIKLVAESDAEMDTFTQIAEVIVDGTGEMVFIYTDHSVHNVSIEVGTFDLSNNFISGTTVFGTSILTPGDAVMLQAVLDDTQVIRINYNTDEKSITQYISLNTDGTITLTAEN